MRKIYFIAQIKELILNGTKYTVFEKVSLSIFATFYDTLEEAEKDLFEKGSKFTDYTIITQYYNND